MKSNKRTIFLLLLLLLIGAVGYPILRSDPEEVSMSVTSEPVISEEVNKMLNDVLAAKLDVSVLNSSELLGLNDLTLPLIGVPIGRQNPFAPIR